MRAMRIFQQAIAPPSFTDEQESRLALLLHRVTLGLALLALIYTVTAFLFYASRLSVVFGVGVFALCLILNRLTYAGYVRAASFGLALGLWLTFTAGGAVGESAGVFDASFTGYILPIIIASFLLGGRAGITFAFMSSLAGMIILIGQAQQPNTPFSVPRLILQWGAQSLIFVAAAYLLVLSRRSLIAAIVQSQTGETILADKNAELQRTVEARQQAENAERIRYERLVRAFHSAGLETWHWDVRTNQITYPDADSDVLVAFSQTLAEFYDRVHPDDRETVRKIITDALAAKTEFEMVFRYFEPPGKLIWYYSQGSPNFDADGNLTQYIGSSFDITSRRIAEEGLHASEAAARAFQDKLKALHEVGIQLVQTATLDELYKRAIELARSRLGFDRIGLFLMTDDPDEVTGTYGTDTQGNLRDEHGFSFSIRDNTLIQESVKSRLHVAAQRDSDLWDMNQVVGRGWNAMAMLWSEKGAIGWLAADNLIRHESPNDDQIELLSLFGSMLGPLILRKQAELETLRHQERLRLALQAGGMFSWTWDLGKGEITIGDVLPSGIARVTRTDEAFAQIHPDDLPLIQNALKRTRGDGLPYAVEYRILGDEGGVRWVYALGQVFRDEAGNVAGIVGVSQDITERKQAEERFYKAFHSNPSAIAITRVDDGRYIEINSEWERITGYSRAETIGHTSLELDFWGKSEDRQRMSDLFDEKGYLRDVELTAGGKDGRKVPVIMLAETIELDGKTCYLTMLQDISERIAAQERFYKAFNANPTAIAINRASDGHYLEINDEWVRLLGYSREETIGHTAIELGYWDTPEDRADMVRRFQERGYLRNIEMVAGAKGGRKIPVLMQADRIELNGEACALTMLQDISGRKEAEKQTLELALQRERIALLTEFMGTISHDIKTPLTAINTGLYLLERTEDIQKQHERIAAIRAHTHLLEKYIQDILTISRLDYAPVPEFKPVRLDTLLRDIGLRLRSGVENKRLLFRLELNPDVPPVMGDADELARALVNLAENAVNYTPAGGTVSIRTAVENRQAVVEVTDTGIGIGAADIAYIFNRFYRAEPARSSQEGGTGLGLAIVKKIVEMHRGSVEVSSVLGQGSTFRIRLPLGETSDG